MRNLEEKMNDLHSKINFSGNIVVKNKNTVVLEKSFGYSNRGDQLENNLNTRFGIASGCKLFTAIAICQLVEKGILSFESKLRECLSIDFKHIDSNVTIHQLLTHTSGVPDYFDEEVMDDFEELWIKHPMYHIRKGKDFLPLFQNEPMKSKRGEKFHYNNAGFILLGLIVEQASNLDFTEYVQEHIFKKANMLQSGYFSFDRLPTNTAFGYTDNPDGSWKTNIYSLPVMGGADGGAYVTVHDMIKLWEALLNGDLLNHAHTQKIMTTHTQVNETGYYGYGVWIKKREEGILKYHIMGYDPGVSFHSAYYPEQSMIVVVCSNKSRGAFDIMSTIEEEIVNL